MDVDVVFFIGQEQAKAHLPDADPAPPSLVYSDRSQNQWFGA
jgi:hypothetical protein